MSSVSVAVDVSGLSFEPSGIRRYTYELVRRLRDAGARDGEMKWFFFGSTDIPSLSISRPALGSHFGVWWTAIGRFFNLMVIFPVKALWVRPDFFWAMCQRVPIWLPKSTAIIVTVHDVAWRKAPHTMRFGTLFLDRILMNRACEKATLILTGSNAVASELADIWPEVKHKVRVTPFGSFHCGSPSSRDPKTRSSGLGRSYMLFVGTMEPRKNIRRLLKAFSVARGRSGDWPSLWLIGGLGWGGVDPAKLIQEFGLQDSVKWLGVVSDAELHSLYEGAVCLIAPSLYEGFCLPIAEAISHGTPVISSDVGAMREVAADAAIFVDPLSVESIAGGIRLMVMDVEKRAALRANALRGHSRFGWDETASRSLVLLRELASLASRS